MQKVSKQFISNLAKTTNIVEFMEDAYDCEFIFLRVAIGQIHVAQCLIIMMAIHHLV